MLGTKTTIIMLSLVFFMNGYDTKSKETCEIDDPVFVWPLSLATGITETVTNTVDGAKGLFNYGIGVGDGIESAIEFSGETGSFVNLFIPENDAFVGDYTIQFYVLIYSVTSGILMQYKSDVQTVDDDIEEWKLYLVNGNINVEINDLNDERIIFDTNIIANSWFHVMLERDISRDTIKLYLNRNEIGEKAITNNLVDKVTMAPGILYLGQESDQQNNLHGLVSCLQIIPCKETVKLQYDSYCKIGNGTNVRTNAPTSTFPTSSDSLPLTATSLHSSGPPLPTIVTPLLSSGPSLPSTVTTSLPSTLLQQLSSTAPLHSTAPPLPNTGDPNQNYSGIQDRCSLYKLTKGDATFNDAIVSTEVVDIVACSKLCNQYVACFTFAVRQHISGYSCKLGIHNPSVLTDPDSKIYSRN